MHTTTDSKTLPLFSKQQTTFFKYQILNDKYKNSKSLKGHHACCSMNFSMLALLNLQPGYNSTRMVSHHCHYFRWLTAWFGHIAAVGPPNFFAAGDSRWTTACQGSWRQQQRRLSRAVVVRGSAFLVLCKALVLYSSFSLIGCFSA
jgi:hypothetical protein